MKLFFTTLLLSLLSLSQGKAQTNDALRLWVGDQVANKDEAVVCRNVKEEFGTLILNPQISVENTSTEDVTVAVAYTIHELVNGIVLVCGNGDCIPVETTGSYQSYVLDIPAGTKKELDLKLSITNNNQYAMNVSLQVVQLQKGTRLYNDAAVISRGGQGKILAGISITTSVTSTLPPVEAEQISVYDLTGKCLLLHATPQQMASLGRGIYICRMYQGRQLGKTFKYIKP